MDANYINDEQLDVLLNELGSLYGYDFTEYARSSMKRRVNRLLIVDKFTDFDGLLHTIKNDANYFRRFVEEITVNVTEMYRDPATFRAIREKVLPDIATHPFIRIWHAGCSTGEEVYSMAIMLHEANLLHKSLIYATDLSAMAIENIKQGVFPVSQLGKDTENYIASGGKRDFSEYYTVKNDTAIFNQNLKTKIITATHNLVSDSSFNEFQLIFCRNVLIYFNKNLQDRVLSLFDASLEKLGYLVLGTKENIRFTKVAAKFAQPDNTQKIWRKTW